MHRDGGYTGIAPAWDQRVPVNRDSDTISGQTQIPLRSVSWPSPCVQLAGLL